MERAKTLKNIVSITSFNRGQASKLFNQANSGDSLIVVKNNKPVAVVCGFEEYTLWLELYESIEKELGLQDGLIPESISTLLDKLRRISED